MTKDEIERVKILMNILGLRSKSDYYRLCILNPPLEIFSVEKYKHEEDKP